MTTLTSNNVKFVYSSFKERYYTESNQFPKFSDFSFTNILGYDQHDATYTAHGKKCVAEFKIRDVSSTAYPSAMIEKKKFDYLMGRYQETGELPIYQCYYNDGVCLLFNLLKCQDIQVELIPCPKYTMNRAAGKTDKYVLNLPTDRALRMQYNIPAESDVQKSFYSQYTVV
ncbi:hypothetical protein [uncultured Pontibacter sp.]|uniref:hypothetical protein n=1 Tax=uncultured Pontibacter sp. TaxID=453356 RepID=UPI00262326E4|nr:hypothetical protein [uncultured Pontibacter sp.]